MEGSDDELPYKPTTSVPRLQRLVLVALATIESLLTSGVIFGWSALLLLLENEGVYAELCPLEKTCAERTTRFELIFTAASTVFALSVWPTGFVLDRCAFSLVLCAVPHLIPHRFGPRISCCVGSVLFFLGLILFGVSNSRDYDYYLPGTATVPAMVRSCLTPAQASFSSPSVARRSSSLSCTYRTCSPHGRPPLSQSLT